MDYEPGGRAYQRLIIALAACGVATFAQMYSPQGLLPTIASSFEVSKARAAIVISISTGGLAASALLWSLIGDRLGRPKALKVSLVISSILGLLMPLMPTFQLVLVVRLLEGLMMGAVPTLALAYLTEQLLERHAMVAVGIYVSGNTIGGLAGRLIAAPVGDLFGWRIGVGSVAVICVIATAVFIATVPEPHRPLISSGTVREVLTNCGRHLRSPAMLTLFSVGFLMFGSFVAVYNYLGFRLQAPPFNLPTRLASMLFIVYLTGSVSSRYSGRLALRWGRRRTLLAGIATTVVGILITLVPNIWAILTGLAILTGGYFLTQGIAAGWVGARAVQGRSQATSLYNMAYYAGSAVIGWAAGYAFMPWGWPGLVGCLLGLCTLATVLLVTNRGLAVPDPGRPSMVVPDSSGRGRP